MCSTSPINEMEIKTRYHLTLVRIIVSDDVEERIFSHCWYQLNLQPLWDYSVPSCFLKLSPFLFSTKCFCAALRAECYRCTTASPQICLSFSTTPGLCTMATLQGAGEAVLRCRTESWNAAAGISVDTWRVWRAPPSTGCEGRSSGDGGQGMSKACFRLVV